MVHAIVGKYPKQRVVCVLRGGAFNNNPDNVRCAVRNNNRQGNRNNNIGFRVVLSTLTTRNKPQLQTDSVMAWNNHASYANTLGLRKQLFSSLPDDLAVKARRKYHRILERRFNQVGK